MLKRTGDRIKEQTDFGIHQLKKKGGGPDFWYFRNEQSDNLHFVTFFLVCVWEEGTGTVR